MSLLLLKLNAAWRLGAFNIGRALWYRLSVRMGLNPVRQLVERVPEGVFFSPVAPSMPSCCTYQPMAFGLEAEYPSENGIPLWHHSVLNGVEVAMSPWWQLPDFIDGLGDIKGIWELSRLDWAFCFARQALGGDACALNQLNMWLTNWCESNPPYLGANWKCGKEASIRVMHLAMVAHLLDQVERPAAALVHLIYVHLRRIAPTIQYAIAQDNNHGTSEAAALFIGGSWLASLGPVSGCESEARGWMKQGRKWLENRSQRLIAPDGSFSQYSLNYHRVMLDSYSMAETWRRQLGLPAFSNRLISRLQAAVAWLGNMVSPDGSDTPNLGANDGARLLPLADSDYRDVRPSVQLASVLFSGARAFEGGGSWNQPLQWLKVSAPRATRNYSCSRQYDNGGFAVLRDGAAMLLFRYPRFHFRPGQSDLLHVDFWLGEANLLRDAGSYSYNCEEPWQSYFPSSAAHNTVQFDGRDAMPRLSRFLFGAWPKAHKVKRLVVAEKKQTVSAGYCDWKGASHHRAILLTENGFSVTDELGGFKKSAVLRWRLAPGEWCWDGDWLVGSGVRLRVTGTQSLKRCELVEGWESRYYSRKTPLPVLEIEVEEAGRLTTELRY